MIRRSARLLSALIALAGVTGCSAERLGRTRFVGQPANIHPALALKPVPAGLGVNTHFFRGNEQDWKMITEAGLAIFRTDVAWARCERSPDQYDFGEYDRFVNELERRGIWLIWVIDYGNPLYGAPGITGGNSAIHTDAARQASARFCAAIAERYAGKKIIWELWNEPNLGKFWGPKADVDEYMAWCKTVVPPMRRADPKVSIVGPALSRFDFIFLEACFKRGLLTLVDGVTVHPYRGNLAGLPGASQTIARKGGHCDPETVLRDYARLRRLIARYAPAGKGIPVLNGEWGYSTTHVDPAQQGKYLSREWLTDLMCGVPVSIWYDWHDDGRDPADPEHNFGIVTRDYKPKPAYLAAKTLIGRLRGYEPVARIDVGSPHDFVLALRKGDAYALAIWTTRQPHEIELPTAITVSDAVDHLGHPVEAGNTSRQRVADAPRYLGLAGPTPAWLRPR
jgi:hypothetical protein